MPSFHTPEAMAELLRRNVRYRLFGKPVKDSFGRAASSVDGIDRDRDVLILKGGGEIGVDEYVRSVPATFAAVHRSEWLRSSYESGYLLQARVVQRRLLVRLTGMRLGSLGAVVLNGTAGPRLFRVTWWVPVGRTRPQVGVPDFDTRKLWPLSAARTVTHHDARLPTEAMARRVRSEAPGAGIKVNYRRGKERRPTLDRGFRTLHYSRPRIFSPL